VITAAKRSELARLVQKVVEVFDRDAFVPTALIDALRYALEDESLVREEVLTVAELAARWKLSRETLRGLIENGHLRAFDVGRGTVHRWRIPAAWVAEGLRGLSRNA
jgi:excisionase family DNA binding protein